MNRIKDYLTNQINELDNERRFYDMKNKVSEAEDVENKISSIREELECLSVIESKGEGNLIRFNEDGTFRLWCVRVVDGKTIVEHYNTDITTDNVDYLLECSDCLDVTDTFSFEDVLPSLVITDDLSKKSFKGYVMVDNDTFEEFVSK